MDKKELYTKILQLDGLTNEEKSELLGLLRKQKKYGLVWEDKPEDVEERLRDELPVLIEDTSKAIISQEADAPNHILIEGDNLEALTALAYTHEGKIDVIYIDPPYNTGNKDFVYNDHYVDKEDSYRHSKWLSFMNKRLRIAKQLLSDRGVIFISIDDNEQAQLKLLCDEVFGYDKLISNLIWQKKTGAADANGIATITEYILVYCQNPVLAKTIFNYNKEAFDVKRYRYKDEYIEERGPFYYDSLDRGSIQYSDGLNYGIKAPDGTMIYPNGRTSFMNDGWTWKWSKEKVKWGIDNKFIEIVPTKKKGSGWAVKYKIYLNVDNEGHIIEKSVPYKNLITGVLNADAANDIKSIFNSKAFNYAKPLDLILLFIKLINNRTANILDFFAGSGTTLHATMQLNSEDGGHRKCILVTNNENNICEEVTYERNKRVINGYTTPKGEAVEGLTANTLHYYRTDFVGRNRSMRNMRKLMSLSTDMLCIKEDLYTEQSEFAGQKTYANVFRYFYNGTKRMMVIYREEAVGQLVELILRADYEGKMKVYVFSPSEDPWEGEFEEVADKVELCALPQAIYNAYKRILPKKKDVAFEQENNATDNADKIFDGILHFDE
ncbi:site-specific DNA-methyltransferase [Parabacteroides sp. AF17-28]|uniref:site-specific DNA-methyltransferase n=1 Tax=Parabacteroides sp. AF17-28 TaxID=2292241 RepID=UPI000F005576|nr:site-specific DNA-methyltransferase [Parabacteroides sp. AF17-28]RHR53297.1 site-specific DNA-methyltransferase [Parabacteroides sp. AF17-28]